MMTDEARKIALSIPCRRKLCEARAGEPCDSRRSGYLHQVRYNDAHRILEKREKLKDWKQLYGDRSE